MRPEAIKEVVAVSHINRRGEVEALEFVDDSTMKTMADTICRNERYRATMAQLKEARRYQRRIRKSEEAKGE
jgi:hypothetical protein